MSLILTKYHITFIRTCLVFVLAFTATHYVADYVFQLHDDIHEQVGDIPAESETVEEIESEEQLVLDTDFSGMNSLYHPNHSFLRFYTKPVLSNPSPPPDLA